MIKQSKKRKKLIEREICEAQYNQLMANAWRRIEAARWVRALIKLGYSPEAIASIQAEAIACRELT